MEQEADCHFVLLSELPQELPAHGLQCLHKSYSPQHSSWRISFYEYTVRNQVTEEEIFKRICENLV